MLLTRQNAHGWTWDNLLTADNATTFGLSVNGHASNETESNYTNISTTAKDGGGSTTTLARNVFGVHLLLYSTSNAATERAVLGTLAIDPAGGTSWQIVAEHIAYGQIDTVPGLGMRLFLPVFIPAGSSVGWRFASQIGGIASKVTAHYLGAPNAPECSWVGTGCESIGVTVGSVPSNCDATAITPGSNGSLGTWTSLGTCTKRLSYINLCPQIRNATMAARNYVFELGWGDGTNIVKVVNRAYIGSTSSEVLQYHSVMHGACDIPAGATIYARGTCSGAADTGWTVMALGVY